MQVPYRELTRSAAYGTTLCPSCNGCDSISWQRSHDANWLVFASCCSNNWAVCLQCPNLRCRMENNRQICRHSRTKHIDEHDALLKSSWSTSLSVEASSLVNDGRGEEDVIPLQPSPNGQHDEEDVIPLQPPPESSVMDAEQPFRKVSVMDANFSYFNDNSRRFFKSDLVGQGTSVLVARSQSRVDEICSCDYLHDYEVKYHMDIAKIVSFLPIRHVELLSSIIRQTIDIHCKRRIVNPETELKI